MAKVLNVSKSGFYAYLNRPKSKREIENEKLLKKIKEIHTRSHGIYGYPNITKKLEKHGAPVKIKPTFLQSQCFYRDTFTG
jgi:putative transposase